MKDEDSHHINAAIKTFELFPIGFFSRLHGFESVLFQLQCSLNKKCYIYKAKKLKEIKTKGFQLFAIIRVGFVWF